MGGAFRKVGEYFGVLEPVDDPVLAQGVYPDYVEPVEKVIEYTPAPSYEAQVTPIRRDLIPPVENPEPKPSPDLRRISTIHPRSYNDARVIGEAFRGGTPVIINLSDMDDADAKRLVDFSAGLIFGLHGGIERVTSKVFLLSPEHVEVLSEDDVAPATGPGRFYNQS